MSLAARVQRLRAGFLKAIERERTEAHPTRPAIYHEAQNPVFRALGRDAQIEAATIGIHARFSGLLDFECRQPRHRPCHRRKPLDYVEPFSYKPVHNYGPN
jgi:hypothetical protein